MSAEDRIVMLTGDDDSGLWCDFRKISVPEYSGFQNEAHERLSGISCMLEIEIVKLFCHCGNENTCPGSWRDNIPGFGVWF